MVGNGADTPMGRNGIGRIEDDGVGLAGHHCDVFETHLGWSILSDAHARMGAHEFDVGLGDGRHPDEVVRPGEKTGKRRGKRNLPTGC